MNIFPSYSAVNTHCKLKMYVCASTHDLYTFIHYVCCLFHSMVSEIADTHGKSNFSEAESPKIAGTGNGRFSFATEPQATWSSVKTGGYEYFIFTARSCSLNVVLA